MRGGIGSSGSVGTLAKGSGNARLALESGTGPDPLLYIHTTVIGERMEETEMDRIMARWQNNEISGTDAIKQAHAAGISEGKRGLYRKITGPQDGQLVQFLAVYALRWMPEWGEAPYAFIEATAQE
jgi:hypothetical protein